MGEALSASSLAGWESRPTSDHQLSNSFATHPPSLLKNSEKDEFHQLSTRLSSSNLVSKCREIEWFPFPYRSRTIMPIVHEIDFCLFSLVPRHSASIKGGAWQKQNGGMSACWLVPPLRVAMHGWRLWPVTVLSGFPSCSPWSAWGLPIRWSPCHRDRSSGKSSCRPDRCGR